MARKKLTREAAAVVTGAGSGIGRAFALELARRGSRVVCADINLATAEDTVAEIVARGGQATALRCDVSQLAEVEALADQARGRGVDEQLGGPVEQVDLALGVAEPVAQVAGRVDVDHAVARAPQRGDGACCRPKLCPNSCVSVSPASSRATIASILRR